MFAIPTTCGTGSEISPAAVITDPDTHYKHLMLNCTPDVAILDPNLVAKMPAPITAATGMDALTHAIEAYVNPGNTPFTRMFATRAIHQISAHLRHAVNGPDRPGALRNMLYAADIAGQSMAQGLGQVHGLSHVVSGRLGTPHGVANAILLVTFAEQRRRDGLEAVEAALDGAKSRLRPILMTSFAMIAGMIPMALAVGEGGDQTAPLGRAVIGGLAPSTVAVLLILPLVFAIIQRKANRALASLHPEDATTLES